MCQNLSICNFGIKLGLICGKYFIKTIFDVKIGKGILEILDVPNLNKF